MTNVKCKKCKKDHDYKGENKINWTCPDCRTLNKLPAITLAVVFSLALLTMAPIFAETANIQYDTENLQQITTIENNQTNADGSFDIYKYIAFQWHYDNVTEAIANPPKMSADPIGDFFERVAYDGAGIFKPIIEPIAEIIESIAEVITPEEPKPTYTHEEQLLIDNVYLHCEKLNERLTAIGRAFVFEYESDEFYVKFPTKAKLHSEDCRARLHLGDNMLSSMYDALKEEAKADAKDFADIKTTDISKKSDADYSIAGGMWEKRAKEAFDYANSTLVEDYGYGQTYDKNYQGDPVRSTNDNSPSDRELKIAKLEQKKLADDLAQQAACETYWANSAGYGFTATSKWKLELSDGTCDGRILDYVDDNNVIYYLNTTQIYIDKALEEEKELQELRDGRAADSEAIKQRAIEKAKAEYERLTSIPKTNSTDDN